MLSIEEIKKILNDENIPDEEVMEIRDNPYGLAEIAIENYIKEYNIKIEKIIYKILIT